MVATGLSPQAIFRQTEQRKEALSEASLNPANAPKARGDRSSARLPSESSLRCRCSPVQQSGHARQSNTRHLPPNREKGHTMEHFFQPSRNGRAGDPPHARVSLHLHCENIKTASTSPAIRRDNVTGVKATNL